jgi:acetolactate synthase-1/2/3 large subunit
MEIEDEATARTGADLVVECLAAEGIDLVAGVPGTTVMDLIDSLARQQAVRFVSTRHEQVAGFLADGVSRSGAGVGVCLVSRGPGAANAAIAVQNAYDESVPLVLLVGQVSAGVVERRAFEESDVVATFRPMSKWAVEIHQAERVPELLQRAVRTAVGGRPGPVVVSLPLDVLQDVVDDAVRRPCAHGTTRRARLPRRCGTRSRSCATRRRPVVLVGGGWWRGPGRRARARRPARSSAAHDMAAAGLRPARPSAFLGALGYGAHSVTEDVVRDADVLVALGCRFSEFTTKRWTLVSSDTRLVHVDVDPEELGRVYLPEVGIVADAALAARALTEAVDGTAPDLAARRADRRSALRESYERASSLSSPALADDDPAGGVSSVAAVSALQGIADTDGVCSCRTRPSFGPWSHRYLRLHRPGRSSALRAGRWRGAFPRDGAGAGPPGQRVGRGQRGRQLLDGRPGLRDCVRESIPVVNVVMNNSAYGNTRDRQRAAHAGAISGSSTAIPTWPNSPGPWAVTAYG